MLHILLLEDSLLDAELIEAHLQESGLKVALKRVDTCEAFQDALESGPFDVILADYSLPSFDGFSALKMAQMRCPDLPFIFVSATLGEEVALETLKSGATDYVLKQRLERLVPSVQRAIREAREHRDRLKAEAALQESDRRFRMALKNSFICIFQQDRDLKYQWIHNPQGTQTAEEIVGETDYFLFPEADADYLSALKREVIATRTPTRVEVSVTVLGELRDYDLILEPVFDQQPNQDNPQVVALMGTALNITERKRSERELYRREQQFRALAENAPDIITRFDRQLRHIYINPAIEKATGIPPQEFIGKTNAELGFPEKLYLQWSGHLEQIFATGEPGFLEFNFPSATGTRTYQSQAVPEFDLEGNVESLLCISRDVTESKKAEQVLRESEARFRRLMDSNTIGMGFWQGNCITVANDAFLEMMGYSQEDLQREPLNWRTITPPEYAHLDENASRQARQRGYTEPFEKELFHKNGTRIPVILGGAIFDNNADAGVFFTLDLTDRKRMEEALQQQAEALERANQVKDEFLAVLSHELRSPLNAILGWSQLLLTRKFDEATTHRALETIERNARFQTQLIEDLLDVSRILRGKLTLKVTRVNLATPIYAAIESLRLAIDAKSLQLDYSPDPTVPPVMGDSSRLQQVVWNLLSNAVKFTEPGGQVRLRLTGDDRWVILQLQDTGVGILPEFLPHLFEYFRQADASSTRNHGGLGIGLGLVRHLVELHGGTVSAESPGVGQGATFTVKLPAIALKPNTETPLPQSSPQGELTGVRVLVVDDDDDSLEFMQFVLEQSGCQVRAIASTMEALAVFSDWQPDLVISDIAMPEEDGYSFIRKIRAMERNAGGQIPAVALTAYAREEDRNAAFLAGFQEHLSKPIDPKALMAAIELLTRPIEGF
ncbi:response regulator [Laspinema olomoucense]|uniref:response regulator n=1 Tax=Laspinema olomoucense TaxID=3231600 RepID=UPI0021BA7AE5|nr:response regulator [Laspinema sp. D3d]MCT7972909.1 response regulator [Laspinema sp. D3d]